MLTKFSRRHFIAGGTAAAVLDPATGFKQSNALYLDREWAGARLAAGLG